MSPSSKHVTQQLCLLSARHRMRVFVNGEALQSEPAVSDLPSKVCTYVSKPGWTR